MAKTKLHPAALREGKISATEAARTVLGAALDLVDGSVKFHLRVLYELRDAVQAEIDKILDWQDRQECQR